MINQTLNVELHTGLNKNDTKTFFYKKYLQIKRQQDHLYDHRKK